MSSGDCPGEPGDLIIFQRWKGLYDHYAVNVGNGDIIHATSISDDQVGSFDVSGCCSTRSNIAMIKKEKYIDFKKPNDVVIVENSMTYKGKKKLPVEEIIRRANSRVGERDFSVLWNNCEHFARWCRYGKEKSDQADGLFSNMWAAAAAVAGLIAAVLDMLVALGALITTMSQISKEKGKKS